MFTRATCEVDVSQRILEITHLNVGKDWREHHQNCFPEAPKFDLQNF